MERNDLRKEMVEVYNRLPKSIKEFNGTKDWVNLADFGGELKKNGIDYKLEGFEKLQTFIDSYSDVFEKLIDNSQKLPVVYLRKSNTAKVCTTISQSQQLKSINPKSALTDWAYLGHYPTMIDKLKSLALEEDWVKETDNEGQVSYRGLSTYLHYTFYKLHSEDKIIISKSKQYAVFNTGLVDHKYDSIFALFTSNENKDKQLWRFLGFCINGEDRNGKNLVNYFGDNLPEPPSYFVDNKDMFYDISQGEPICDFTHIIIENVERLPYEFIERNAPNKFDVRNPDELTGKERNEYFENLKHAINNDSKSQRSFKRDLESSLELAIKRVRWNYKSAIPMYYPRNNKMCFLLPLCLVDDNVVDLALVVSKGDSGKYQGETIYLLNWAYGCARLVCRPDSDWLNLNKISTFSTEEED